VGVLFSSVGDLSQRTHGCKRRYKPRFPSSHPLRHSIQRRLDRFRLQAPDRVRGILANAGFHSVAINPLDARIGGADVEQTLNLSLEIGPLGAVLREHPELTVVVADAVRDMLAAHLTPSGVVMPAATRIVTGQSGSAGV
jgi:hypothetical protein